MENDAKAPLQLLKPHEAAKVLGLHPQTLANFRHRGGGPPFVQIGTAIRYSGTAIEEFIQANTRQPKRRAG